MTAVPYAPGEVEPGVTLADLATVEACDGVLDRLQASIVSIEQQLGTVRPASVNQPPGWRARATAALRAKKLMLPRLQERRADLKRRARQDLHGQVQSGEVLHLAGKKRRILIGIAWEHEPDAMRRVEALARELHPALFLDREVAR